MTPAISSSIARLCALIAYEHDGANRVTAEYYIADLSNEPDDDEDGIPNMCDNCVARANADQRDTDQDGYGNSCDADFNNDNITNAADLAYLKLKFFSSDPHADLNGDGFDEAVIGANRSETDTNDQGEARLMLGSANGLLPIGGTTHGLVDEMLGYSISDAGDINGDNRRDLRCRCTFDCRQWRRPGLLLPGRSQSH